MLIPNHRLSGIDIDPCCVKTRPPGLVETYVRKCLNFESDIKQSDPFSQLRRNLKRY